MTDYAALCEALKYQRQLDKDGVEVGVSRQACDEAATAIKTLLAERDGLDRALAQCRALLKQECEDVAPLRAERDAALARCGELEAILAQSRQALISGHDRLLTITLLDGALAERINHD
jgi:chromosome segregation ATPase